MWGVERAREISIDDAEESGGILVKSSSSMFNSGSLCVCINMSLCSHLDEMYSCGDRMMLMMKISPLRRDERGR